MNIKHLENLKMKIINKNIYNSQEHKKFINQYIELQLEDEFSSIFKQFPKNFGFNAKSFEFDNLIDFYRLAKFAAYGQTFNLEKKIFEEYENSFDSSIKDKYTSMIFDIIKYSESLTQHMPYSYLKSFLIEHKESFFTQISEDYFFKIILKNLYTYNIYDYTNKDEEEGKMSDLINLMFDTFLSLNNKDDYLKKQSFYAISLIYLIRIKFNHVDNLINKISEKILKEDIEFDGNGVSFSKIEYLTKENEYTYQVRIDRKLLNNLGVINLNIDKINFSELFSINTYQKNLLILLLFCENKKIFDKHIQTSLVDSKEFQNTILIHLSKNKNQELSEKEEFLLEHLFSNICPKLMQKNIDIEFNNIYREISLKYDIEKSNIEKKYTIKSKI